MREGILVNKYRLLFTNLLREENYTEEVEEITPVLLNSLYHTFLHEAIKRGKDFDVEQKAAYFVNLVKTILALLPGVYSKSRGLWKFFYIFLKNHMTPTVLRRFSQQDPLVRTRSENITKRHPVTITLRFLGTSAHSHITVSLSKDFNRGV